MAVRVKAVVKSFPRETCDSNIDMQYSVFALFSRELPQKV